MNASVDKTRGRKIIRDAKSRISRESSDEAWQEYLSNRPLQDEELDVPLGFELEEDVDASGKKRMKVKMDPKTGQPVITLRSLWRVSLEEFKDAGPGVAMTYIFMRDGAIFFFIHGMLQIPGYVLQVQDPLGHLWVGAAIFADLVFTYVFSKSELERICF